MNEGRYFRFGTELVQSRRLLLDVLEALDAQKESLTVVGAHAVFERVKDVSELAMDSTRDADLAVFPHLVASTPALGDAMESLGLTLTAPSRPGVWGRRGDPAGHLHGSLTVDLIAPAALAGSGRRAARLNRDHGRNSVSKTAGLELSLIDRSILTLEAFDSSGSTIQAYVAGTAALICAKAYKLHDRFDAKELSRNAERLRPKDAGDLWLLMRSSDGAAVRAVFDRGVEDSRIDRAVALGIGHVVALATNPARLPQLSMLHLCDTYPETEIRRVINEWIAAFR